MSYPQLKLDYRSIDLLNAEDSNKKEDAAPSSKSTFQSRPLSEKILNQKSSSRPISATYHSATRPKGLSTYKSDDSLLYRLRPVVVNIDKETLYEENMSLKLETNKLKEDLIRATTKVSMLEKELNRVNERAKNMKQKNEILPFMESKKVHLVPSLKETIKELRHEIKTRIEETEKLKRSLKYTNFLEMETEIKAFSDESTRLRHHLSEILKQKDILQNERIQALLEEKNALISLNNQFKKDIHDLTYALDIEKAELEKLKQVKQEIPKPKKKPHKKKKNHSQEKELKKTKEQLEFDRKEFVEKENSLKRSIENYKQELFAKQSKVDALEKEVRDLQASLKNFIARPINSNVVNVEKIKNQPKLQNPIKVLWQLHQVLTEKQISIDDFLASIENNYRIIKISDFLEIMKKENKNVEEKYMKKLKEQIKDSLDQYIPSFCLISLYESYEYNDKDYNLSSSIEESHENLAIQAPPQNLQETSPKAFPEYISPVKLEQIQSSLNHIKLKMQLNRFSKSDLQKVLFDNKFVFSNPIHINYVELSNLFSQEPFDIKDKNDSENLSRFLFQSESDKFTSLEQIEKVTKTPEQITKKLLELIDEWEVYSQEAEEKMDQEISALIQSNKVTLKTACKLYDTENSGIITIEQFKKALEDVEIQFSPKVLSYLVVLFYSHSYQLDTVPYKFLIKAYGNVKEKNSVEEESVTNSDEERAEITREFLGFMAEKLKKRSLTVRDAFKNDKNGLISPKKFIKGLSKLNIKNISEENIKLILDALQYEKETIPCISIDELEEILYHYGIATKRELENYKSNSESNSRSSSEAKNEKHYRESSNFLEYSEDSPEKSGPYKSLHYGSEGSPFGSAFELDGQKNSTIKSGKGDKFKLSSQDKASLDPENTDKSKFSEGNEEYVSDYEPEESDRQKTPIEKISNKHSETEEMSDSDAYSNDFEN
ncbi:unnamed protein product [Blepharisma stoltei]|uniref:EF-hand domain-containing protein n=1 Tax=Blepharisma stoltei TaxID=1481888 RepID=A0AAU9JRE4_9CILI|nr:unnamed protein product [Blepharisma stoltei]